MLTIDGSHKHGGGSILRLASAFSVLMQKPIRVINIRANRPNPGLQQQHLQALRCIADLCNGELIGAELNSREIEFYPKPISKECAEVKIPTAGSVGLVLYPIILASAYSNKTIKIRIEGGATVGKWAPPTDFLENVTFRLLERIGIDIKIKVLRHGFYPKGGARLEAEIHNTKIKPLRIEKQGELKSIKGISLASTNLKGVAERQKKACEERLKNIEIKTQYVNTLSSGSCITIWMETENCILGSDCIGERGIRAEIIGKRAAEEIMKTYKSGATVDKYAADQLIPFLSLVKGSLIKVDEITGHIETSIWLSELFTNNRFEIISENSVKIIKN